MEGVDTLDTHVTKLKEALDRIRSQHRGLPEDMQTRIKELSE